ncbi:hypothetical protein CSOJ01_16059 [Colletotrichum sojae]|uniref:Uncharacterized protein n=1 Tax=Colletotrichum sojae TaxID=2175907 RepID=A0A8H6IKH3_9PEZI|nr:hypothetical protein CSOJ01_16059 [Colletotrichum sojae]
MLNTRNAEYIELKARAEVNSTILRGLLGEVKTLQKQVCQGHESLKARMEAPDTHARSSSENIADDAKKTAAETPKRGPGRPRNRPQTEPLSAPQEKRGRPPKSVE